MARIERWLAGVAREVGAGPAAVAFRFPAGLVVVQGSQALDLDSLAGSIAYARLLHEEQPRRGRTSGRLREERRPEAGLVVPRLPIPRRDLGLRPELLELLRRTGIAADALIDREALVPTLFPKQSLSMVLVDTDGRELPPSLRERIVEIVDHHGAAGTQPGRPRRIVAEVSSACTLVAEQILRRMPSLLDRTLALLLLGPILLDTVNLDPGAGRVSERDRRAAVRLSAVAGSGARGLYEELLEARARLDGLSGSDLLRRDYKEAAADGLRYGMASVPVAVGQWLTREAEPDACLREFAEKRGLDLLLVLFGFGAGDGVFRRQLLLQARGELMYRELLGFLKRFPLGLSEPPELRAASRRLRGAGEWQGGLFKQGEVGVSRKRLEPALVRFLSTLEEDVHGG